MMKIPTRKISLALFVCAFVLRPVSAQPTLKTTIDKNQLLIGEQLKLQIVASLPPQDFFVKWVELPDSLPHFELVAKSKIDSTFSNQKLARLSQTLTFTSFDSGRWTLPAFNIDFNPSNGDNPFNLYTDSFSVAVSYQADSTNKLRDIKDIREIKTEIPRWIWFAIAACILLLAVLIAWLKYYLKKKPGIRTVQQKLSPYQLAMQQMSALKQLDLADATAVKQYHAGLSETLRQYLALVYAPEFASSTTGHVLLLLKQQGFDATVITGIATALQYSDAAKFAKYLPSAVENEQSWQAVKQAIDHMEQLQHKTAQSGT